jgi:hypothetical protein
VRGVHVRNHVFAPALARLTRLTCLRVNAIYHAATSMLGWLTALTDPRELRSCLPTTPSPSHGAPS